MKEETKIIPVIKNYLSIGDTIETIDGKFAKVEKLEYREVYTDKGVIKKTDIKRVCETSLMSNVKTKTGIELIADERQEQIEKHGFSVENDKYYAKKELAQAAKYCLMLAEFKEKSGRIACKNVYWPENWDRHFENKILNKPRIEQLIVAGALFMAENERRGDNFWSDFINLIAAEIDRLQATK